MAVNLGFKPERATLIVSTGADFILEIKPAAVDGPWPTGTISRIDVFESVGNTTGALIDTWTGTVTGPSITYQVEADFADAIPDRSFFRLYIAYGDEEPQQDYLRYYGRVSRQD